MFPSSCKEAWDQPSKEQEESQIKQEIKVTGGGEILQGGWIMESAKQNLSKKGQGKS